MVFHKGTTAKKGRIQTKFSFLVSCLFESKVGCLLIDWLSVLVSGVPICFYRQLGPTVQALPLTNSFRREVSHQLFTHLCP